MKRFEQKVVVITGAGGGSGHAIAEKFYQEGAFVAALDLKAPTWMVQNERFLPIACDVSCEEDVANAFMLTENTFGSVNILVNNAGISIESPLISFEYRVWKKIFAVNTDGVFLCSRAAANSMIRAEKGGRVVNIGSIAGKNGFANSSGYCASKAAVHGFTRALAAELGPYNINVNAICPGSVATPMIESVIDNIVANTGMNRNEARAMMESGIPLKRFQTPLDVANLACFLASEEAANISGETINLDGGVVRD